MKTKKYIVGILLGISAGSIIYQYLFYETFSFALALFISTLAGIFLGYLLTLINSKQQTTTQKKYLGKETLEENSFKLTKERTGMDHSTFSWIYFSLIVGIFSILLHYNVVLSTFGFIVGILRAVSEPLLPTKKPISIINIIIPLTGSLLCAISFYITYLY